MSTPRSTAAVANGLPELLTVEEVASWLKTSEKAVYSKVERGGLPGAVHLGRRLYFIRSELLQFVDQGRVPHLGGPRGGT
ncbi:MAG TPA: helix-turn-helix domain-containing protein [Polyangiaceae bacterium]|nr:helix-turn-helix domain-containing protein [Polyangiaceae bacterium]